MLAFSPSSPPPQVRYQLFLDKIVYKIVSTDIEV